MVNYLVLMVRGWVCVQVVAATAGKTQLAHRESRCNEAKRSRESHVMVEQCNRGSEGRLSERERVATALRLRRLR